MTKHEFAQVFREAWLSSIRLSTIASGFREAGLCPFNPTAVLETKLLPSLQFSSEKNLGAQSTEAKSSQPNPMTVFESLIGEEKVKKFEQRCEEKYDLESDELYSVWLKMKTLTIHYKPSVTDTTLSSTDTLSDPLAAQSNTTQQSDLCIPSKSVLDDILVYPSVQQSKKNQQVNLLQPCQSTCQVNNSFSIYRRRS